MLEPAALCPWTRACDDSGIRVYTDNACWCGRLRAADAARAHTHAAIIPDRWPGGWSLLAVDNRSLYVLGSGSIRETACCPRSMARVRQDAGLVYGVQDRKEISDPGLDVCRRLGYIHAHQGYCMLRSLPVARGLWLSAWQLCSSLTC